MSKKLLDTDHEQEFDDEDSVLAAEIPASLDAIRLDQALARLFPQFSRSRLQQWIRDGYVFVDEQKLRAKDKVHTGQHLVVEVQQTVEGDWQSEPISLDILYEDAQLIVINKPVGMVVHPAAGNPGGTMLNALLHHAPELRHVPRAGIVHRLDKDTSGVLVVARDISAHKYLVEQLQARAFVREYVAVVNGVLTAGGTVDAPIGRHPVQRKRMAVVNVGGKPAITHYRVEQRFRAHTLVKVNLETGRTHQIRVHMAHIHHPLVGDQVYGGRLKLPAGCSEELIAVLRNFKHQALHARYLELVHPDTGESIGWEAPIPADMQQLINVMLEDVKHG
ncbi:MAG: 23S rRNA pseudouridine(1911/1915/1917) synthase RluD [Thioalkalispiraceae bacterium]|jgi:23S rRNA pseudouridine1911/1915/1917 synthase